MQSGVLTRSCTPCSQLRQLGVASTPVAFQSSTGRRSQRLGSAWTWTPAPSSSSRCSSRRAAGDVRVHNYSLLSHEFPDAPFEKLDWDWYDQWYPVGFVKDFDPSTPHRFTLLNIPLVIWHQPAAAAADGSSSFSSHVDVTGSGISSGSEGSWCVFADVCPHRLVPLSEGRITEQGLLECAYHGWAFNGQGGCEVIPQKGHHATPRACATAYPCLVRQGLLFVKPKPLPKRPVPHDNPTQYGSSDSFIGSSSGLSLTGSSSSSSSNSSSVSLYADADVPVVAELDLPGWLVQDTWRDVPYDWSTLLENVLDASHVPFTHHKSISNRASIGDYDMKLTQHVSKAGFEGLWPTGPRGGALGSQVTWFRPPCYMQHKIDASEKRGYESMVIVYAVPSSPGKCRLLNRNAFRFTRGGLGSALASLVMKGAPGWAVHLGTQVPLEDDQIFLHLGEVEYVAARASGKTAAQAYYMPSPADTYVLAFRNWIQRHGGGGPFGHVGAKQYRAQLEPRLTQEQLLDRYSQHTANCAQCQAGLRQVKTARAAAKWAGGITAAAAAATAAVAAAATAAATAGSTAAAVGSSSSGMVASLASLLVAAAAKVACVLVPLGSITGGAGALLPPDTAAVLAAASWLRVAWWLLAAGVCWGVHSWLGGVEQAFHRGTYPPPRNMDKH